MLRVSIFALGTVLLLAAGTEAARKCVDLTGDYRCTRTDIYISMSEGVEGGFIYDVEYNDGTYYQYKADDKINTDSDGQYIASCRRHFFRTVFPEKPEENYPYTVEEYSLKYNGDLIIDIYFAEIPEGNMNKLKRLKYKKGINCRKR